MSILDCSHESAGIVRHVCADLLANKDDDYHKIFTGAGCDYWLACAQCAKAEQLESIPQTTACNACFAEIEAEGFWDGIHGSPAIQEEPTSFRFTHRTGTDVANRFGAIRYVHPLPNASGSHWIALTDGGTLAAMDFDTGIYRHITDLLATDIDITKPISLTCSPEGAFICVTETLGNVGIVIDSTSGQRTMRLQRDGYRSNVSPFPAVFTLQAGRTLIIHGTAWNRLDISDPATGELLTHRSPTSYRTGEERPAHYLDYFHGRLYLSPNQDFIADDGWVWAPVGILRSWSTRRWLTENPWESEDGPSTKRLLQRWYSWGYPVCWIDNTTLAVWGYGTDEEWLIPAICLFDVISGEERGWFPGPAVEGKNNRQGFQHIADFGGRIFFDKYLFAVSEKFGVGVWDVKRGMRLHVDDSFAPVAYHPGTKEFLTILPDGNLQLSKLFIPDK